ncbi:protein kinase family protein [Legionella bononiensis]|uniref:Protein kinase family protein n=1 Tax=Legionella bononiensis TaxID=2793102 RepID=A0ABS1WBL5_9GAMM|nr:protein kinase family protein [Legionella bononiensis]MBL7481038.1 protein kinase family protein [Legionella bononiensis]MBL7526746.1 protein kinase family protein [Legionella bononiensis]MBL7564153.1 protein kinase family protein [Legionella bononiensis]
MVDIADLGTLDETTRIALTQLLKHDRTTQVWGVGVHADLNLNFRIIKHFSSGKERNGIACLRLRYEVVDNEVFGAGSFGTFYRCRYTLSINENGELHVKERKPNRVRLVKVQDIVHQGESHLNQIITEATAMAQSDIFHCKPLVVDQDKTYIIMKELPGVQLYSLIMDNRLTIQQRYDLTVELVKALKVQIHDKGWIHRDLKPENILVYQNGDGFAVYIIDFGFISKINDKPMDCRGSPPYAAPECYSETRVKNEETDIYALGMILMFLWSEIPVKPQCYDQLMGIFEKMYRYNRALRPGIPEIIESINALANLLEPVVKEAASNTLHVYYAEPDPLAAYLGF